MAKCWSIETFGMNSESQRNEDMLIAMQAQRDQAMNGLVYAQAEIMALRREIAALNARLTPDTVPTE